MSLINITAMLVTSSFSVTLELMDGSGYFLARMPCCGLFSIFPKEKAAQQLFVLQANKY